VDEGHAFAGCGKTHVLCQGTTLVGRKKRRLMRASAADTEGRTDVFPRGIRLAPEVTVFLPAKPIGIFSTYVPNRLRKKFSTKGTALQAVKKLMFCVRARL
jgi:hypothetical protein